MQAFTVQCGKEKIKVQFMVGCLCVTFKKRNYLIEHHPKQGWLMKVGKLKEQQFKMICEAIEKKVLE